MPEDDIFWNISLNENVNSVDKSQHACKHYGESAKTCENLFKLSSEIPFPYEFHFILNEISGDGILSSVGGQLWESSLLLCAFILLHPNLFVHGNFLEVGSGSSVPAFLVIALKLALQKISVLNGQYELKENICTLSDNDEDILVNISQTLQSQDIWTCSHHTDEMDSPIHNTFRVSVERVDWSHYAIYHECDNEQRLPPNETLFSDGNSSGKQCKHHLLPADIYDVMFGSELIYTTEQVCLAGLIKLV